MNAFGSCFMDAVHVLEEVWHGHYMVHAISCYFLVLSAESCVCLLRIVFHLSFFVS